MKFYRLGTCLALLAAVAACTTAPQAPTAPSASIGGSTAAAADGSTLKVSAPALVSPVNSERAEDRRPSLIWLNAQGRYESVGVAYDIELSTPSTVVYTQTVGETPNMGAHLVPFELEYDTVYSWRVRARVGDMFGPWSAWASFLSPTRPVVVAPPPTTTSNTSGGGCAAPISPLGPGETRKPRPNDSAIVRAVAAQFPRALRNSCQDHGGSWEFMDRTVDALRLKDGRWGYNAKRGHMNDASHDVVSYFFANGDNINNRHEVYIIDIIGGHCGSDPVTAWNDVTDVTASQGTIGRTMYPRPGRSVPSCTAAAQ
ncbi:MAG TPA: hypothetical protein VEA16_00770 [Vicinamibacterales bacterium]|nr:hypothetical protein [Vicinamibacterales bacterium]